MSVSASQAEPRDVRNQAFSWPWLPENAELTHPPKAAQIGTDLIYTNRLSFVYKVCLERLTLLANAPGPAIQAQLQHLVNQSNQIIIQLQQLTNAYVALIAGAVTVRLICIIVG